MKKQILGLMLICISQFSFSEVFVKISEPIRFKTYNARSITSDQLIGEGVLEIYTDNEKEDIGKKITFKFPEKEIMTNKKRSVDVKGFALEKKEAEMIITKKREFVKIYAFLDKNQFDTRAEASIVEGEYIGHVPILLSLYKK